MPPTESYVFPGGLHALTTQTLQASTTSSDVARAFPANAPCGATTADVNPAWAGKDVTNQNRCPDDLPGHTGDGGG